MSGLPRVAVIFGTRPEAIKMAPVVAELQKHQERFSTSVCVTGQHSDLLDEALRFFEINPNHNLGVMRENQALETLTSSILEGVSAFLAEERPAIVLVHGDTSTTFASSLAAFYSGIPVHHVEAGLRTHNMGNPFPEEFNRRAVALMAAMNYAPTVKAKQNLIAEGISENAVMVTGNTVVDAMVQLRANWANNPSSLNLIHEELGLLIPQEVLNSDFTLVTLHRRESFGHILESVCEGIAQLAIQEPHHNFVFPMHPNPNVQQVVTKRLGRQGNVVLSPAVSYPLFIYLLSRCQIVLTDSGGVQEEAPSFSKPVLVVRNSTEREEGVAQGVARLVEGSVSGVIDSWTLQRQELEIRRMVDGDNPFGDGKAARRIAESVRNTLA